MLIVLSGFPKSGKTTVADYLVSNYKFIKITSLDDLNYPRNVDEVNDKGFTRYVLDFITSRDMLLEVFNKFKGKFSHWYIVRPGYFNLVNNWIFEAIPNFSSDITIVNQFNLLHLYNQVGMFVLSLGMGQNIQCQY